MGIQSINEFKECVKMIAVAEFNSFWDTTTVARYTYSIHPELNENGLIPFYLSRYTEKIYNSFRFEQNTLNHHQHRKDKSLSAKCRFCHNDNETP